MPDPFSTRRGCAPIAVLAHFVHNQIPSMEIGRSVTGGIQNEGGIPVFPAEILPTSLGNFEGHSCLFVDSFTWFRCSLRTNVPYLVYLALYSGRNSHQSAEHIHQRIAFVESLPFGNSQLSFAICPPLFSFNAFGTSHMFGDQMDGGNLVEVRIESFSPLELEGIEIGIAETVQIRQINGHDHDEDNEDELIEWHKQQEMPKDEAIKKFFMKPQLLYDGDFFEIPLNGRKKLLYQAFFPSSSSATPSSQNAEDQSQKMPKFVQFGQSRCVELANNGNLQKEMNIRHGNGRFPQMHSGQFMAQHLAHRKFLPKNILHLAKKIAHRFCPLFNGQKVSRDSIENGESTGVPMPTIPLKHKHHQIILLQTATFEGTKWIVGELATLLDANICQVNCFLDLWQDPDSGKRANGQKEMKEKIGEIIGKVCQFEFGPSICWLQQIPVLFPSDGHPNNGDVLDALLSALEQRVRSPAAFWLPSYSSPTKHSALPSAPILFIINCTSIERSAIPERLNRLIQWEFVLADGDDKLTSRERHTFLRHKFLSGTLDYCGADLAENVVEETKGFSLLELSQLITDAVHLELANQHQGIGPMQRPTLCFDHFQQALAKKAPPKGTKSTAQLADVGGLEEAKMLLKEAFGELMQQMEADDDGDEVDGPGFGQQIRRKTGILLYGPPGCGKTLLAKAVANEFGLAFHSVKGPELLSQYVGESERNVRELFAKARQTAPAVLFFDELDSLAPNRGANNDSGGVMDRMVSQLLTELDTCKWGQRKKPIFVMAATNRPDLLDPCLLTPGRFDNLVPIRPATDLDTKHRILGPLCKNVKLAYGFTTMDIAMKCPEMMSGADLAGLIRSATIHRIREIIETIESANSDEKNAKNLNCDEERMGIVLEPRHFECAIDELQFSPNAKTLKDSDDGLKNRI